MSRRYTGIVASGLVFIIAACGGSSVRPSVGRNVDITKAPADDGEVSAAVDPGHSNVLLAGSNGDDAFRMRVYTSTDDGASWTSRSLATGSYDSCFSDPSVAIAADGREYFAYMQIQCRRFPPTGEVVVRTRPGPDDAWSAPQKVAQASNALEDRPVIVVDTSRTSKHEGRIWLAWTTYVGDSESGGRPFVAHSDDHGEHWSRPEAAGPGGYEPSLVVAPGGALIEASAAVSHDAIVLSSPGKDGFVRGFYATATQRIWCSPKRRGFFLRAMPNRGVCTVPSVAVDASRRIVYVAWSGWSAEGLRRVYLRRFDLDGLRKQPPPAVALPAPLTKASGDSADEFLATAAVDQRTGAVWVCFYTTQGDPTRRRARFDCRESTDEGRSWTAVGAARRASDEATPFASQFGYGDYESVVAANGEAHAFWTAWASRALVEDVFTATLRG